MILWSNKALNAQIKGQNNQAWKVATKNNLNWSELFETNESYYFLFLLLHACENQKVIIILQIVFRVVLITKSFRIYLQHLNDLMLPVDDVYMNTPH